MLYGVMEKDVKVIKKVYGLKQYTSTREQSKFVV